MKNLKHLSYLVLTALSLASSISAKAQVLAQWNFDNDSGAPNNSPAASTGTGTADSIGMTGYSGKSATSVTFDDIDAGSSSDTGSNGVADLTNTWRVRGQAATGTASNANGWNSAAPIASQGAQFFTSTVGRTTGTITVSFDWYATTQGESNLELAYTTNGTTWTDVPVTLGGSDAGLVVKTNTTSANTVTGSYLSDNIVTNSSQDSAAGQDWFTGLTATITNPAALNDANFGIEMVNASTGADDINTQGTALNNTSGNWRFDNVSISDAPEPGTWALLSVSGLLFLGWRRRSLLLGR